jgi:hypothetical protein
MAPRVKRGDAMVAPEDTGAAPREAALERTSKMLLWLRRRHDPSSPRSSTSSTGSFQTTPPPMLPWYIFNPGGKLKMCAACPAALQERAHNYTVGPKRSTPTQTPRPTRISRGCAHAPAQGVGHVGAAHPRVHGGHCAIAPRICHRGLLPQRYMGALPPPAALPSMVACTHAHAHATHALACARGARSGEKVVRGCKRRTTRGLREAGLIL